MQITEIRVLTSLYKKTYVHIITQALDRREEDLKVN